jgi:hypothetical protein
VIAADDLAPLGDHAAQTAGIGSAIGVAMIPGATALTRIRCVASERPRLVVSAMSAPLDAP